MALQALKCLNSRASLKSLEQSFHHLNLTFHPNFAKINPNPPNCFCQCSPNKPIVQLNIPLCLGNQLGFIPFSSFEKSTTFRLFLEMDVPEIDKKLLGELEALGFPLARAARALRYSGNASIEAAVNWVIDHETDPDIDEMPLVAVNIDIESPQPNHITEEMKSKAQELRDRARKKKEVEEKKSEREREKERIRAGKGLLKTKRIAEENERKRNLALRKAEKEEEKRARDKILQKLEADKAERRQMLGLPLEIPAAAKPPKPVVQERKNALPVMTITKAERMGECLRSLRRNHKDNDARVKRAFQTLLIYVGNVAKNPDEKKFRKIRVSNPLFQDRVGSLQGGIEFLELCGFERIEGGQFLFLASDNIDSALLNSAEAALKSAITNPFFGLLSRQE